MGSESRPYLSLVIPAYNEEKRIASTLSSVQSFMDSFGQSYELIIVDDGSTDSTLDEVRRMVSGDGVVRVVSYIPNRGKGYAVRQGVIASRGEYIAFSDADLSAPIDQLVKLFDAIKSGYDVAIGSRAADGAEIPVHHPLYRELGGKALNMVIQALAVPGIKDTQCGFKLFRGIVAKDIFSRCFIDGWGFDIEVLYIARKLGYSIAEVPVKWSHAEGSKIHPFSAGVKVMQDIIRIRTHNYGPKQI
ncbi:glycosyltransferase family 2 protein [bacterium]|nr:glycosyltransferase family 2 protein [bacterium]